MGDAVVDLPGRATTPTRRRAAGSRGRALAAVAVLTVTVLLASCSNSTGSSSATSAAPPGSVDPAAANRAEKVSIEGVPGVTDDEIRYTVIGTEAGNPLGTCILDCYADGIEAYFAFRNSQGGVQGRQMVVTQELDDEVASNQVRALEVSTDEDTFGVFNAALVASGWSTLDDAGIPDYVWPINFTDMVGLDNLFAGYAVSCISCSQRGSMYAAQLSDATKVAALGYGVTAASTDCVESQKRSLEKYGDELGMELVYENGDLPFGLPNGVGPEVTAMKEAGADFIITCIDLNGVKTVAQELDRQGMGDVPMLHQNTYDHQFIADAGGLFDGDIVIPRFRPFEAANGEGALQDHFDWMDKTGSERSELAMIGWINADIAYKGILAAGPDFDRAKVIAATNAMTEYSADGLINPIDWTRQHELPTEEDPVTNGYVKECVSLTRVVDGELELIGEADKPFLCWDNSNQDWSEPEAIDIE